MAENQLQEALSDFIATRFFSGERPAGDESLLYSGVIDSLGVLELARFLSDQTGRRITPGEIVEADVDTIDQICEWLGE